MPVPDTIVCVDCGGTCHRLTHDPELGWEEGDVVSFRCADCLDRWDLVLEADDLEGPGTSGSYPSGGLSSPA